MKKINFILILILFFINSCSTESYEEQDVRTIEDWGKEYKWDTKQTNSYNIDSGTDVEIDSKGNIYYIGTTGGGLGIKDTFYGNKIYDSDVFLIKYNRFFEREWVKTITTLTTNNANADNARNLVIDSNDQLIISGHGTGSFDNISNADKIFLIKLNSSGDIITTKQTNYGQGSDSQIALDNNNNIYLLNTQKLVKYNSNLIFQWDDTISDNISTKPFFTISKDNMLYFTSYISNGTNCYNTSSSGKDVLFGKYDITNKNLIWEKTYSICEDEGMSVSMDNDGYVYVSGNTAYNENIVKGNNDDFLIGGGSDCFLIKIDPSSGNKIWVKIFGSINGGEYIAEIKNDLLNNIYITGNTTGSFEKHQSAIGRDIFLIKFDSNGNEIWLRQLGSSISQYDTNQYEASKAMDESRGLTIDYLNNRIYVVGSTEGDLDGNQLTGGSHGSQDAFISRTINLDY